MTTTSTTNEAPDAAITAGRWAARYWAARVDAALTEVGDADARAELRLFYEERAGICEFDGGLPRFAAERAAFELLAGRVAEQRLTRPTASM